MVWDQLAVDDPAAPDQRHRLFKLQRQTHGTEVHRAHHTALRVKHEE